MKESKYFVCLANQQVSQSQTRDLANLYPSPDLLQGCQAGCESLHSSLERAHHCHSAQLGCSQAQARSALRLLIYLFIYFFGIFYEFIYLAGFSIVILFKSAAARHKLEVCGGVTSRLGLFASFLLVPFDLTRLCIRTSLWCVTQIKHWPRPGPTTRRSVSWIRFVSHWFKSKIWLRRKDPLFSVFSGLQSLIL